jgi:hypothetical protein
MPANMKKAGKKYMYGGMKKKKMSKGGSLKPVPSGNKGKGLSKLPKAVRNKMGYKQAGGGIKKKPTNTRQDSVRATLFQNNPNLHNELDNSSRSHMFYNKLKDASKKVGPLDQKTRDRIIKEEEAKMMYGGSKIKKMKPYMYGGKKVPGMFEDDRMMYGGMKKKRMQIGGEQDPGPPVPIDERERRREKKNKRADTVATKPKHNWNDKLTKLSNKRRDSKAKDEEKGKKSGKTKRIQKRINKEYKKINP